MAAELVKRAQVILLLVGGHSYSEIARRLSCTDRYISTWKQRLAGLYSRYRGNRHRRRTAVTEARILELTRRGPSDGSTHWSSYRLAKEVGGQSVDGEQSVAAILAAATPLPLLYGQQ